MKRPKHIGVVLSVLKCFKWKLYRCICWLIFEVILRNARSNDEIERNVSYKSGRENPNILCSIFSFRKSCILWDNMEKHCIGKQARDDIIRRMRFAGWIPKATDTHSEYVIFIAFPPQHWFYERVSMLRYTCTAYLFILLWHSIFSVYLQES